MIGSNGYNATVRRPAQKVWKYAKLAPKQVTGDPEAKIIAPGEVAPKKRNK
jgi:hypothetical protein